MGAWICVCTYSIPQKTCERFIFETTERRPHRKNKMFTFNLTPPDCDISNFNSNSCVYEK